MRAVLYILTSLAVIGLAFWAYRENYATQQALSETEKLHRDLQSAHARVAVLKAEWAYLNRPDRLAELAHLNFNKLGLLPLRPDPFGRIDQIAYPTAPELQLDGSIEVSSSNAPAGGDR